MSLHQDSTEDSFIQSPSIQIDSLKSLLKSRIFLGRYLERRLVNETIGYKDIVLVSTAEVELIKDLLDIEQKLRSSYPQKWIAITSGEDFGLKIAICLWTQIDNEPFGPFWFQIKSLKFKTNQVLLTVKCLRHITDAYLEIEPILTKGIRKTIHGNNIDNLGNFSVQELKKKFQPVVTLNNCKELFTFVCAFIIAIFTGSTSFIAYLGNFFLELISELSKLIKNSTPILLGVLDLIGKIVGGFYILIAMIFRPNNSAPLRHNNRMITNFDTDINLKQKRHISID